VLFKVRDTRFRARGLVQKPSDIKPGPNRTLTLVFANFPGLKNRPRTLSFGCFPGLRETTHRPSSRPAQHCPPSRAQPLHQDYMFLTDECAMYRQFRLRRLCTEQQTENDEQTIDVVGLLETWWSGSCSVRHRRQTRRANALVRHKNERLLPAGLSEPTQDPEPAVYDRGLKKITPLYPGSKVPDSLGA